MSLTELGGLGDLVASFGVIATLIFLALQMRQNTKAVRLGTSHAVTAELQGMFSLLASDQGLAEILVEAGHKTELKGSTRIRYWTFTSNLLRIYENAYLLKRENSISEAHWSGMTRLMIDYKSMAAFSGYWEDRKHWLSDEFRGYMDAEIIPAPPKPGVTVPGSV
ncbi:MAG: hypothetical protein WD775_05685 [Burkholderiales bacterium]